MDSLVETLYFLSTALLVPVIVTLLGFLAWSLSAIGGFAREARERAKRKSAWRSFLTELGKQSNPPVRSRVAALLEQTASPGLVASFAAKGRELCRSELHLSKLVSELEIEAAGRLARMNLGVRVGPMLGLMGTLIPMGPALIGLSTGNIEVLARNLVVAFSTTVLGLFVGGVCYAMSLARRQWYSQDLADIEYICCCLHEASRDEEREPTDASSISQA